MLSVFINVVFRLFLLGDNHVSQIKHVIIQTPNLQGDIEQTWKSNSFVNNVTKYFMQKSVKKNFG